MPRRHPAEEIIPLLRFARPGDARRRSPSPHRGAPPARPGTPSARGVGVPALRAAPGEPGPDRRASRLAAGPRAGAARPAVGTGARHRAGAQPGSPPRGPRGGGGDRAAPGSRAWLGRPAPNGARDAPRPAGAHSPGSGSPGPGGEAPAAAPGESSGSGPQLPGAARLDRAHHRARAGRWRGIRRPPPTRADAPRTKLSREKCRRHPARPDVHCVGRARELSCLRLAVHAPTSRT
jgi:hypothetical protein